MVRCRPKLILLSRASALASALLLASIQPLSPQVRGAQSGHPVATSHATRAQERLAIDGRLDEDAWSAAVPVTTFTQRDPEEGRPVSQPTAVRLLYDEEALYVGAVLSDSAPVSTRLARRDSRMADSDWFSISLDSYHAHTTAYRFMVNPAGVRADEIQSVRSRGDDSWDPVWQAATQVTDSGWTVEMRIPFSQLRFSEAARQTWGLQLERTIARRQEEAVFAFTPKSQRGGIPAYGHLEGLEGLRPASRLELLPYVVGRAEHVGVARADGVPFDDPFRDGSDYFADVGLDLKYRLGPSLTLDATFNPDFGQVEVDPAVVNLSAFETRFSEKRPFFVEGSEVFRFGGGGPQFVYSRRIGSALRWNAPSEAVYSDAPEAATILAAGKVTGRTEGGWSVGVLQALTGEASGRFVDLSGNETREVFAPLTSYFAGRASRDLREGSTMVGALATAVNRRVGDGALAGRLPAEAYVAGLDVRHEWSEREWALNGHIAASHVAGAPGAMQEIQQSSARYFQRPDAGHLAYDPLARSLGGYAANLQLRKESGLHWRGDLEVDAISPGFEANDLGFHRDADRVEVEGAIRYVENAPGRLFRSWRLEAEPEATWNHGGDYLGTRLSFEAGGELLSYWSGELDYRRDFAGLDDRLTRGGPLVAGVAGHRVSGRVDSDSRRWWTARVSGAYAWDAAGGRSSDVAVSLGLRPGSMWSLSLGPRFERGRAAAQFIGSVADPRAEATHGRRYLFAELDQTVASLETRLNVTFRPGLTLELFAQPFLASAAFEGVKELRAPRTFDFLVYGADVGTVQREGDAWLVDPDGAGPAGSFLVSDDDFNRRSLRGNAVLRWEWRPGSTLFLVWQQLRSERVQLDDFGLRRDARALFGVPPDNVFVLKVSYWLSP